LFSDTKVKYEYVYTYNSDLCLEEIQQKIGKQTTVTWNRKEEEKVLIRDISTCLTQIENKDVLRVLYWKIVWLSKN
jgi:hypothetical protein